MVFTAALPLELKADSVRALVFEDGSASWNNDSTEKSLLTSAFSIPANRLQNGDSFEIEAAGTLLNNSGGAISFTFRTKLAAAAAGPAGAYSAATNASSSNWWLRFLLTRLIDTSVLIRSEFSVMNVLNTNQAFRRVGHATVTVADLDTTALAVDLTAQITSAVSTTSVTPAYVVGRLLAGPLPR